jgi:thiol-disulfide isomerase/thioredoxin
MSGRSAATIMVCALLVAGAWLAVRHTPRPDVPLVGHHAPDYRVARLASGDSIGVRSGYAGHVTLINIWATWCGPCVKELPSMEQVYRAYRDRGFRVAAVSIDNDSPAMVLAFTQRLGLSFDILHDRIGDIQSAYLTVGVPESFLLDKHGNIAYIALGGDSWDSAENRQRIEHLLAAAD